MDKIGSDLSNMSFEKKESNKESFLELLSLLSDERAQIKLGGGILFDISNPHRLHHISPIDSHTNHCGLPRHIQEDPAWHTM